MTALEYETGTAPAGSVRLLAGVHAVDRATSLHEHLAVHGPLPRWRPGRGSQPGELVAELEEAGLRGRGGGWFPAARKWHAVAAASHSRRPIVVANGMEGEPASAKDQTLLTLAPHLVLDGAVLAARALGAPEAVVAVHDGSPAHRAVAAAIGERRDDPGITVVAAPPRYVASEESALARFVGEGVSLPRFGSRPFERGVRGRPTLVQNVETLAHTALIARYGADWFRWVGTPDAPGTALVTVTGAVAWPGVVEVTTGTTIAEILERCGGTTASVAGLLTGGYGGAWLPATALDVPWTPEAVSRAGGTVGAGVLVVLPDTACLLEETARVARWLAGETAGQCGPCRMGLPTIADDLDVLVAGGSSRRDLERLRTRLGLVTGRGACRMPDGAARLVDSALRVAREDVAAHLAGRCRHAGRTSVLGVPASRENAGRTRKER